MIRIDDLANAFSLGGARFNELDMRREFERADRAKMTRDRP